MLQQTQTPRVILKYRAFLKKFPNFKTLARASNRRILSLWQGLGYNRRALGLKRLSRIIVKTHRGKLPTDPKLLVQLPMIGHGTAGAILAFAFHTPWPFIETNIRRVFIHFFFPKRKKVKDSEILPIVKKTLDSKKSREWYFALMDYGAMLGKTVRNPNRKSVRYRKQSPFRGSRRELRGKIIKLLLRRRRMNVIGLAHALGKPRVQIERALAPLIHEGFISRKERKIILTS